MNSNASPKLPLLPAPGQSCEQFHAEPAARGRAGLLTARSEQRAVLTAWARWAGRRDESFANAAPPPLSAMPYDRNAASSHRTVPKRPFDQKNPGTSMGVPAHRAGTGRMILLATPTSRWCWPAHWATDVPARHAAHHAEPGASKRAHRISRVSPARNARRSI